MKISLLILVFSFVGIANAQDAILYPSDLYSNYNFGASFSTCGSNLAIGTRGGGVVIAEAVYVFNKQEDEWIEETRLVAPDTIGIKCFGCAIAVSNNNILVGAPSDDENGTDSGAAYVFTRENGSWLSQGQITPLDATAYQIFGSYLAIDGDRILIAATGDNINGLSFSGSAYIFRKEGEEWIQEAKLIPSDPTANAIFGNSVSLSGDYAFVGAVRALNEDAATSGAVYIFKRVGDEWIEQSKLIPPDGMQNDGFGKVIAKGDTLFVGAVRGVGDNEYYKGAGYIYVKDGEDWIQLQKIISSDEENTNKSLRGYGFSGEYIALSSADNTECAPVYLFKKNGTIWEEIQVFTGLGQFDERFGHGIDLTNEYLFVGARHSDFYSDNDTISTGGVYVFDLDEVVLNNEINGLEPSIRLYPNPSAEVLKVELEGLPISEVQIFDINGKQVSNVINNEVSLDRHSCVIDLKALNAGTYIIVLTSDDYIVSKRFIKL